MRLKIIYSCASCFFNTPLDLILRFAYRLFQRAQFVLQKGVILLHDSVATNLHVTIVASDVTWLWMTPTSRPAAICTYCHALLCFNLRFFNTKLRPFDCSWQGRWWYRAVLRIRSHQPNLGQGSPQEWCNSDEKKIVISRVPCNSGFSVTIYRAL